MVSLQILMVGLAAVSVLTTLSTQALKKLFRECGGKVHANIMASIVSIVISVALCVAWAIIKDIPFDALYIFCMVAFSFFGWLCALLGYDKIKQSIKQIVSGGDIDKMEDKDGESNND